MAPLYNTLFTMSEMNHETGPLPFEEFSEQVPCLGARRPRSYNQKATLGWYVSNHTGFSGLKPSKKTYKGILTLTTVR